MHVGRRTAIGAAAGLMLAPGFAKAAGSGSSGFSKNFLWGVATSGHQTEGNNSSSDYWWMENANPTLFKEPSGDAVNSFLLWEHDLDIVKSLGLNTYRFSIEWSRIEPEEGLISVAMLDHYRQILDGCQQRGLKAVVSFNHFACPRWFAAKGGWSNPDAPQLFARYCAIAARALAAGMSHACTMNEPNLATIMAWIGLPRTFYDAHSKMLHAAGRALGVTNFSGGFMLAQEEFAAMIPIMGAAHQAARAAIKAVRPDLPVGLTLAISDDQAAGGNARRDQKRREAYEPWFKFAENDDFIGVQNYDRTVFGKDGILPPPKNAARNYRGVEVYPQSLSGAVEYAHKATGKPILVTEHGVGSDDDTLRGRLIREALAGLQDSIARGTPVIGYIHWSLLDNYEWYSGFDPKFGLVRVDRQNFQRSIKPSALILKKIAETGTA